MILDTLKNIEFYKDISPRISTALENLQALDLANIGEGRYEIDGDNIFYIVERYETKPVEEGLPESHKRYIDIQVLASGREMIGYVPNEDLEIETPYDNEKDISFYKPVETFTKLNLRAGVFVVFFADEAHMPGCELIKSQEVVKIVFKVKV